MSKITKVLQPLGAIPVVSLVWTIFRLTRLYIIPSSPTKWKHDKPFGLVTGGTDGIGWGFANALANEGFNVILLGRNPEKLESRRTILKKKYPDLAFEILVFDVMNDSYDSIPQLVSRISHLNVTILVNNIGGMPYTPGFRLFTDHDPTKIDQAIDQNSRFMVHFTWHMFPALSKNGPALVLNVGSAAKDGVPWASVYSGTKGFVLSFSKALSRECKLNNFPVDVLNINVGEVSSSKTRTPPRLLNPRAEDLSQVAVNRIGAAVALGLNTFTPYVPHAALFSTLGFLPESLQVSILGRRVRKARETLAEAHKAE